MRDGKTRYHIALGRLGLAAAMLSAMLIAGCHSPSDLDRALTRITRPYRFGLLRWELGQLYQALSGERDNCPESSPVEIVKEYFILRSQIETLRLEIARDDDLQLVEALEEVEGRRQALRSCVEQIISQQVAEAYAERGIYQPFDHRLSLPVRFPPLCFALEDPPHILVVSPRERIESIREVMLRPDLSVAEMEMIEEAVEALGYSALVVEIGGLGVTYPPFITDNGSLSYTIGAVAEEWLHQYLAFTPLGVRYVLDLTGLRSDYEIATMNETVAGIVQEEIREDVLRQTYGWEPAEPRPSLPEDEETFDFRVEMRRIRVHVDGLLIRGEVERAEAYMQEQREYLARNGYFIRELNQAYFAFHGTYAETPASTSPIGAELRQLREQSTSLRSFLNRAVTLTSREQLIDAMGPQTALPTTVPTPTATSLPSLKPNWDACGP